MSRRRSRQHVIVAVLPRKRGDTYRAQWRYQGRLQWSPTYKLRGDAETVADHIEALGGRLTSDDPRVKSGSLLADGPDAPPHPSRETPATRPAQPTQLGYWLDRWIAEEGSPRSRRQYLDQA